MTPDHVNGLMRAYTTVFASLVRRLDANGMIDKNDIVRELDVICRDIGGEAASAEARIAAMAMNNVARSLSRDYVPKEFGSWSPTVIEGGKAEDPES